MNKKYVKVNLCAACGEKAGHMIWTTSRQVNLGIKVMYPNEKLCQRCYDKMRSVYPDRPLVGYIQRCHCGGIIQEAAKGIGGGMYVERYCNKCGVVIERGI
jgi:hypothetical protein